MAVDDGREGGEEAAGEPTIDADDAAGGRCAEQPPVTGAVVPMRRLTAPQLSATVQDVLGAFVEYPLADETLIGYRGNTSGSIDTTTARILMTSAEDVVEEVAAELAADTRCQADCASLLLDELGPRLFRRPLDDSTRARFEALHAQGVSAEGPAGGVRWVLSAMLQSPRFLYMLEGDDGGGRLEPYSIASRLSYALWGGPPDQALLDDAAGGALDDDEGVRAAVERMLDDARFERGLEQFVEQWLSLEELHDPSVRPDIAALDAATQAALAREPVQLLAHHVRMGSSFAQVLQVSEVADEPALSELYGEDVLSSDGERAQLDPQRRAGLLTLPGVLAALSHAEQTSPTLRGRSVLSSLLCAPPPPPPPDVNPTLPPSMPGATTRERLEAHLTSETCAGCHRTMDGIGFAFERFDWLGRSRELDNGKPIDSSAELVIGEDEIMVEGAPELVQALSQRSEVAACMARHFSRFALSVGESDALACEIGELTADGGRPLRDVLLELMTLPWMLTRGDEG